MCIDWKRMDTQRTEPLQRKLFCDPPREVLPILRRFVVLARCLFSRIKESPWIALAFRGANPQGLTIVNLFDQSESFDICSGSEASLKRSG